MRRGRKTANKTWTLILMSMVVAFVIIVKQSRRKSSLRGKEHFTETISNGPTHTNNYIPMFGEEHNVKEYSSLKISRPTIRPATCGISFLPKGFEQLDEYENYLVNQSEIYSKDYIQSITHVESLYGNATIRLHPDRFLYPALFRGPNNQLIGLREAVYVAIRLNRTLVIPRFQKHRTDQQLEYGNSIHPAHRINVKRLCMFVSCISAQQFRKACGNQADVIMRLRRYSPNKIAMMESVTGLRFSTLGNIKKKIFRIIPSKEPDTKSGEVHFGPQEDEIRTLFQSKERCAIYAQPFYNLKIKQKPSKKKLTANSDIRTFSDSEIFSQIIREIQAPRYIQSMAEGFINFTFNGQRFLAVHWRYDKEDWMKRCGGLTSDDSDRLQRCNDAAKIKPPDVAQAIFNKAKSCNIRQVYIAVPESQRSFADDIKAFLSVHEISVYGLGDVTEYMKSKTESCEFIQRHQGDTNSSIDMQICRKSSVFMKSTRSSWSGNVAEWRRHDKTPATHPADDEDIFGPATTIMRHRLQLG